MDWNPGTCLPPSAVAGHKFDVRLPAVRNVLLPRGDGAGTPLASSAGGFAFWPFTSVVFLFSFRSFLLLVVRMMRVARITSALGAVK